MPEGPEVLRIANSLQDSATGRTIKSVEIVSGRYFRLKPDLSRLTNAKIKGVLVCGKLIKILLSDGSFDRFGILSTMGMTGGWLINPSKEQCKHLRIKLVLDDGTELCFVDQRNFGTFKIVEMQEIRRKTAELGPDIMYRAEDYKVLVEPILLERIRRFGKDMDIAEATLDQRFFAGCGNYIRADALYLAQFSPRRKLSSMGVEDLHVLWKAMNKIAFAAYHNEHPILGHHAQFENLCYGLESSYHGDDVHLYEDKNGRTMWWCPARQE